MRLRRAVLLVCLLALPLLSAQALAAVQAAPAFLQPPFQYADEVLVNKSERRMYLLRNGDVLREFVIRLGPNPVGHKRREGDGRTPEGRYTLATRNPNSEFFLSLWVSYPNAQDRQRAAANGDDPGGGIMIHGLPNIRRFAEHHYMAQDWTDGCIAVSDADMIDIWMKVRDGTPITIRP